VQVVAEGRARFIFGLGFGHAVEGLVTALFSNLVDDPVACRPMNPRAGVGRNAPSAPTHRCFDERLR
jgi:hypothetical protein